VIFKNLLCNSILCQNSKDGGNRNFEISTMTCLLDLMKVRKWKFHDKLDYPYFMLLRNLSQFVGFGTEKRERIFDITLDPIKHCRSRLPIGFSNCLKCLSNIETGVNGMKDNASRSMLVKNNCCKLLSSQFLNCLDLFLFLNQRRTQIINNGLIK
jgi:hypothetical protein